MLRTDQVLKRSRKIEVFVRHLEPRTERQYLDRLLGLYNGGFGGRFSGKA
jgi:hypothetical protein